MSIVTQTWRSIPGDYFFICTKSRSGKWIDKAFSRDELGQVDAFIDANTDKNLYWCPHGFKRPRRKKEYAVLPALLWSDLDDVDPRKLNGTKPTLAWESSPGRFAALWHIDRIMTEELNKRLSYSIGADKGGWDITQVLRVPGTMNYKYGSSGKPGRLLWSRPKEIIKVAKLKAHLKELKDSGGDEDGEYKPKDRAHVYARYQKRISMKVRQLLMAQKAVGDRSEVLWKIWHGLFDAGMSVDEAITVVSGTVWNKFADRPKQLKREAEKVIQDRLAGGRLRDNHPEAESEDEDRGFISMNDVVMKPIGWVAPGWLPKGKLTIIEGDPGVGKSWFMQYLCVQMINGEKIPHFGQYGQKGERSGRVMYVDLENDPETDTKPRLLDMGLSHDKLKHFVQYYKPFSINDWEDYEKFEAVLEKFRPKIVVFDTIMLYMGGTDTHKASDVQQALSRLSLAAQEYDCAIVLVRHLGKTSRDNIKHAGLGSIAFTGMARMVHTVRTHPNDEEITIVKTIKSNFCKPEPALKFHIEPLPPKQGRFNRAKVHIDGFDHDLKDSDLTAPPNKKKKEDGPVNEEPRIERLLEDEFEPGGVAFRSFMIEAEKRSITKKSLDEYFAKHGYRIVKRDDRQWLIGPKAKSKEA